MKYHEERGLGRCREAILADLPSMPATPVTHLIG